MDFTPIIRPFFLRRAVRIDRWKGHGRDIQRRELLNLLRSGSDTEYGRRYGFAEIAREADPEKSYRERVPMVGYEDIRGDVMRMIRGEHNVLWPGRCRDFAQSSGTSGGQSKYIPITGRALRKNHYAGGSDCVAMYLRLVPESRIFSGKSFILGGSFSNTLGETPAGVSIGDLSATLINRINPLANMVRIPDKRTALMSDWEEKLPALVKKARGERVTNISGVPSWFMKVIREILASRGKEKITEVWPDLEVFFHGGISFEPYRAEYERLTEGGKMHFLETYNASEGFFAVQNDFSDHGMLLLIDNDIYYEFLPTDGGEITDIGGVEKGRVYELVISGSNGLWRYRIGDTVKVTATDPVKITIAGRTRSFINAFGEELMEDNAERAMAEACRATGSELRNYTGAPLYGTEGRKGRHQWLVEWDKAPRDLEEFGRILDRELRKLNSDYDAKRSHSIFLDGPEVMTARDGLFDLWLSEAGSRKLGGQRKVPRLQNGREIMERLLELNS